MVSVTTPKKKNRKYIKLEEIHYIIEIVMNLDFQSSYKRRRTIDNKHGA